MNMFKKSIRYIKRYWKDMHLLNTKLLSLRWKYINSNISGEINILGNKYDIQLGNGCTIGRYTTIAMASQNRTEIPKLIIGSNTYIGEYNNIRIAGGEIIIGSNCLISQHITFVSSNHQIAKDRLICEQPWTTKNNFIHIDSLSYFVSFLTTKYLNTLSMMRIRLSISAGAEDSASNWMK